MFSKKYRPCRFSDLIGQEANVVILKEILKRGAVLPLIFTGPFGSGKTSASRVFAKAVLCKNLTSDQEPCCQCSSCVDFEKDQNINYNEIDAASNGDVDSIRELREEVGYNAIGSKFKVTNIDEAHNITKQGYNALLKILEEGVDHHIFIFCTNEPEKMLDTVRSRCWRIHSAPVTPSQLATHLDGIAKSEGLAIEDGALDLISKVTAPHIRDALNVMEFLNFKQKIKKSDVESYFHLSEGKDILHLIEAIENPAEMLMALDRLLSTMDVSAVFDKLLTCLLDLEAVRVKAKDSSSFLFSAEMGRVAESGKDFLSISQLLIRVERPVDSNYLRHLLMEASRLVNGIGIQTHKVSSREVSSSDMIFQPIFDESFTPSPSSDFDAKELFQAMSEPEKEQEPIKVPESGSRGFRFDSSKEVPVKHESNIDLRNHDNYKLLRKRKDLSTEVSKKKQKSIDPMSEPVPFDAVERYLKDKNR